MLMRDQRAMIIRHIHYASERETQTETQEKQASEELQSEEVKRSVWKQMCTSTGRHRQPERVFVTAMKARKTSFGGNGPKEAS